MPIAGSFHRVGQEAERCDQIADFAQAQGRAERCVEQKSLMVVGPGGVGVNQTADRRIVGGPKQIADENQPTGPNDPQRSASTLRGSGIWWTMLFDMTASNEPSAYGSRFVRSARSS